MSPKKRYPLEPLLRVREEQVDECARNYTQSAAAARRAENLCQQAEQATEQHEQRTRALVEAEFDGLEAGQTDSEDMMRLHAWRLIQARRAEELKVQERVARARAQEARQEEEKARQSLASARADAKIIEKHRRNAEAKEQKEEERRLETEIEDLVNARRRRNV